MINDSAPTIGWTTVLKLPLLIYKRQSKVGNISSHYRMTTKVDQMRLVLN